MNDGFDSSGSETGGETGFETGSDIGSEITETTADVTESETAEAFDEVSLPFETLEPPATPEKADEIQVESRAKAEPTEPQAEAKTYPDVEKADASEAIHVTCKLEELAGKEHPETGVSYETKVVEVNGKQLEVTVPNFESQFDCKLESDQLTLSRYNHNTICNAKLQESCATNPEWASKTFTEKQLDMIQHGKTPEGYTWHHDGGEVGHMQLVDSKIHDATRHTGGVAIWGTSGKYD